MQGRSNSGDRGAERVLVVNDDWGVREVIISALEREHCFIVMTSPFAG